MDRERIKEAADEAGLPVCYAAWPKGAEPPMPYVAYRFSYSRSGAEGGIAYAPVETWQVELYSEAKDQAHERLLEDALCSRGWAVDKREYQHFDPYPYIQTIYIVTTVG